MGTSAVVTTLSSALRVSGLFAGKQRLKPALTGEAVPTLAPGAHRPGVRCQGVQVSVATTE
jgi:hypothetical protein